jgi:hypothetical protein
MLPTGFLFKCTMQQHWQTGRYCYCYMAQDELHPDHEQLHNFKTIQSTTNATASVECLNQCHWQHLNGSATQNNFMQHTASVVVS